MRSVQIIEFSATGIQKPYELFRAFTIITGNILFSDLQRNPETQSKLNDSETHSKSIDPEMCFKTDCGYHSNHRQHTLEETAK